MELKNNSCFLSHRLIFQQLHMSNTLITVIGLIVSIISCSLLGDWQAIRPDPCTRNSLFHHPELQQQYIAMLASPVASHNATVEEMSPCERPKQPLGFEFLADMDIYVFPTSKKADQTSGCEVVQSCPACARQVSNTIYSVYPICLYLQVYPTSQCINAGNLGEAESHHSIFIYSCSMYKSQLELCMRITAESPPTHHPAIDEYVSRAHVQTVQVVEGRLAALAEEMCESQPHHSCHWNPHSEVTGRYCEDCPPICRDKSNYLHFSQFLVGATLLAFCAEIVRVSIFGILSDLVHKQSQVKE